MEPVKISDIKDWSSIDIYLFSNGQQYSPPRKYHLRSEELQWWGNTMSYLGRTHYGAGHSSIELYAIDGTKVNGPLELLNGAAYVAVEPPDSFVNTGYEQYLLKASRSWEKRLAQKSYNTETSNPDLKRLKNPTVQNNIDDINEPEKITDTATLNVGNNATAISPQKPRQTKPNQRLQRKSITSSKPIQKKKSCDTHSAILKRICADTDKAFPSPKKTTLKKYACVNRKPSTITQRKLNEAINQEQSPCCKKCSPSIKPDSNPTTEVSKKCNVNDTIPVREPQIIDLFKNDESELTSLKNDPERYALINNSLYYHEQHDLTDDSVAVVEEYKHITKTETSQNFEKHSSIQLNLLNDCIQNDIVPKNEVFEGHQENTPIINNNKASKAHDTLFNNRSEKQVIDEYVAHMNKGGLLLLKLKVKLKDCKTIFNKDNSKDIPTTNSLSNLLKTEKTSQADINISLSGELLKSNDQQYTQDKSLQSLLNKLCVEETNQINSKNPRIIILQCACREYSGDHKCCMCNTFDGNEHEGRKGESKVNEKLNKTYTSEGDNESLKTYKNEYAIKNGPIIQSTKEALEDRPSLSEPNGTRVKNLAQKFERAGRTSNDKNSEQSDNKPVSDYKRQSMLLTRLIGLPVSERGTDKEKEEENNSPNLKSICDKSTQTEWCNVLLEARHHADDNYTFHLPSLYILKQCNL